jgi:hypothetical protein
VVADITWGTSPADIDRTVTPPASAYGVSEATQADYLAPTADSAA